MTVYRRPDPIPLPRRPTERDGHRFLPIQEERQELPSLIARRMFETILAGHYPEGNVLPNEITLSRQLAVSRTALREAVKILSAKGVLEAKRRRGTIVLDRLHWNMLDTDLIAWARRSVDPTMSAEVWAAISAALPVLAEAAARQRHAGDLAGLAAALATGAPAATDAPVRFLLELAGIGNNRILLSIVSIGLRSLHRDDPHFLRGKLSRLTGVIASRWTEAIARGDAEGSASLARRFATADSGELAPV